MNSHGKENENTDVVERPKRKKKWPLIVGGLAVIGIVAAVANGGGGDSTSNTASNNDSSVSSNQGSNSDDKKADSGSKEQKTYVLGDTASLKKVDLTVSSFEQVEDTFGSNISCAVVSYKSTGDKKVDVNTYDWKLQNPAGVIVDATIPVATLDTPALQYSDIAPGGQITGSVCFNTDGAAGDYTLTYEPTFSLEDSVSWALKA